MRDQLTHLDAMVREKRHALRFFKLHPDQFGVSDMMIQILEGGFSLNEPFIR